MCEEEMVAGCIKNKANAQELLYNRFATKMLAVCYRFANNRQDAEDMLQEGFIKVFSQIKMFKFEGSFEGWVRKVMVYTCINYLKKYRKLTEQIDVAEIDDKAFEREASVTSMLQVKQITEIIRSLPVGYKTVFNLFAIEGFSHKEIADSLNIKESSSRSQYTRAKQFLEKLLIENGIIEHSSSSVKKVS